METVPATPITLEICVDSLESAQIAARAGAHRLELCADLAQHGLTPSADLIATVRAEVSIPVFVMIRPRPGNFCYSPAEFAAMQRDIDLAKNARADGVVFGILSEDRTVDQPRNAEVLAQARPLQATFHRAFDVSSDLTQSLETIIHLGFDRVLTSGGAPKVEQAIPVVNRLQRQAAGRIALMIGSGINSTNVRSLIEQTGVREVHSSARRLAQPSMRYRSEVIAMDTIPGWEERYATADEEEVRKLVQAIKWSP
ncbi:MAG TPA: copper homeostasis protein CutC [Terriglobales bacterium]|nr:copper homeostasis protein CutC [Terriglobales bacterium]